MGVLMFGAMLAWAHHSGDEPSNSWFLPFGILAIALGLHLIVFREEVSEFITRARARWRLETRSQSPRFMIVYGLVAVIMGLVFLYGGLVGR